MMHRSPEQLERILDQLCSFDKICLVTNVRDRKAGIVDCFIQYEPLNIEECVFTLHGDPDEKIPEKTEDRLAFHFLVHLAYAASLLEERGKRVVFLTARDSEEEYESVFVGEEEYDEGDWEGDWEEYEFDYQDLVKFAQEHGIEYKTWKEYSTDELYTNK